jgi:CheY-like chemotaxis protein
MGIDSSACSGSAKPVLIVEDSEDDVVLLQRQLLVHGVTNPILVMRTGDDAIRYLSGTGEYADRAAHPLPCVLLLDLKLPGNTDGLTVLKWVRRQPSFQDLLVIVISKLEDPAVIRQAYQFGANSYIMKPANGEEIRNLLRGFSRNWAISEQSNSTEPVVQD